MLTLIRKATGWALGHVRLIIEYALLALVVTLAGAVLYGRIHAVQQDARISSLAGDLNQAAATINEQVAANKDQDAAIAKLNELRELDGKTIAALNHDLHQVGAKSAAISSKLAQLEKHNAQAKALLDTPVPDAVGCVLDRRPCPAASDAHQGGDHQP